MNKTKLTTKSEEESLSKNVYSFKFKLLVFSYREEAIEKMASLHNRLVRAESVTSSLASTGKFSIAEFMIG